MLRPAFAIVFALALTGCVFLVDSLPDDTSTTCHLTTPPFSSGDNACKTCITTNCQTPLNACCGDTTCQAQLDNVDSCASESGCAALAAAGGTEGATTDLISCIANACGSSCSGIDAGPANDASTSSCSACKTSCVRSSTEQECSCVVPSASQPGNTVNCDDETFTNSICCASTGWPSVANGSCACETLFCDDNGGDSYCSCQLGSGSGDVSSCYPGSSGASSCCVSADQRSCTCDPNNPCDQTGETSVDHCGTDTMPCSTSGSRPTLVSTCSQ